MLDRITEKVRGQEITGFNVEFIEGNEVISKETKRPARAALRWITAG